jgi:hypothetical protein
MTAVASARERELADALSAVRARLGHAAETAGRNADEIELLPITKFFAAGDVLILRRLGCLEFGESRENEASNKARKSVPCWVLSRFAGTWSDSSATKRGRSRLGVRGSLRSTAPG